MANFQLIASELVDTMQLIASQLDTAQKQLHLVQTLLESSDTKAYKPSVPNASPNLGTPQKDEKKHIPCDATVVCLSSDSETSDCPGRPLSFKGVKPKHVICLSSDSCGSMTSHLRAPPPVVKPTPAVLKPLRKGRVTPKVKASGGVRMRERVVTKGRVNAREGGYAELAKIYHIRAVLIYANDSSLDGWLVCIVIDLYIFPIYTTHFYNLFKLGSFFPART